MRFNDPVFLEGGSGEAILLLHGITSGCAQMVPMAKAMNDYGYSVHCVNVAGHGTYPQELLRTSFEDMIDKAEYQDLRSRYAAQAKRIQEAIDRTSEAVTEKIDWTKAWSKKYPVLNQYQKEVDTGFYAEKLSELLMDLKRKYSYDELNAFLVLKDILAAVWKSRQGAGKTK